MVFSILHLRIKKTAVAVFIGVEFEARAFAVAVACGGTELCSLVFKHWSELFALAGTARAVFFEVAHPLVASRKRPHALANIWLDDFLFETLVGEQVAFFFRGFQTGDGLE